MSDNRITWNVSPEEAQVILLALQELPFRQVAGLIPRLVSSANEQMNSESVPAIHAEGAAQ